MTVICINCSKPITEGDSAQGLIYDPRTADKTWSSCKVMDATTLRLIEENSVPIKVKHEHC